jgi:tetratricopeptide (TPR) repeat protein
MDLTKALQQAITHHKAGDTQDAERLYRSILNEQASHPDANHNLGIILKQGDQTEAAVVFFKTALDVNPNQGQFWISYIDALIHLGRLDAARSILEQGQSMGLKGEVVDQLASRIQLPQYNQSPLSQAQIDSVVALYSQGQLQEALDEIDVLIKDYPNESLLYNISGACYQALNQLDAAVKSYEQALVIKPDFAEARNNLGNTLQKFGELDAAVKCYEQALVIKPDYAEAKNNLGNALSDLGQLDGAVKCYEQALVIKPDYAEAKNNLGNALSNLGQLDGAVKCYEQALVIKPDYAEAKNNLGNTFHELDKVDDAVKCYEEALVIKPDYAEAYNNLGVLLNDIGQLNAAANKFERALAINPNNTEVHYNLGITFMALGQLNAAVKNFEQALAIKPDYAEAHNNLGVTLKKLGQLGAAVKSYERALAIKPNFVEAHSNLGFALMKLNQVDAAALSCEKALSINSGYVEAHNNLGLTFNESGQLDAAVKSYEQALAIKPDYAEAHSNLGVTLKELGQLNAAVKSYGRALAINPDFAMAYYNLGLTYTVLGQLDNAIKSYQKALELKPDYADVLIHLSIYSWLNQDLEELKFYLTSPIDLRQYGGKSLQFVNAYKPFLTKLFNYRKSNPQSYFCSDQSSTIYVVGESHCLPGANRTVKLMNESYCIKSRIIIGCKAWHLANGQLNEYKKIFKVIADSIPKDGTVILTIGEIDCRLNEGIIKFHKSTKSDLTNSINGLVHNYIRYIVENLDSSLRTIIISGVPCISETYKKRLSNKDITMLSTVIKAFNNCLKSVAISKGFKFLDVYTLTQEDPDNCFIDDNHLTSSAFINAIQTKLI